MRKIMMASALMLAGQLAMAGTAQAAPGDWIIRGRGTYMIPTSKAQDFGSDISGVIAGNAKVNNAFGGEVDFTYMATEHVGVEFAFGGSSFDLQGTVSNGDLTNIDNSIATGGLLVPSVTLQYHPAPNAAIRPYIGAGVAYTLLSGVKPGTALKQISTPIPHAPPAVSFQPPLVDFSSQLSYVGQLGFDIPINDKVFFNVDAKYIGMKSTAIFTVDGNDTQAKIKINPVIVGVGVGFRF